jgi:hypothetical protein
VPVTDSAEYEHMIRTLVCTRAVVTAPGESAVACGARAAVVCVDRSLTAIVGPVEYGVCGTHLAQMEAAAEQLGQPGPEIARRLT